MALLVVGIVFNFSIVRFLFIPKDDNETGDTHYAFSANPKSFGVGWEWQTSSVSDVD